MADYYAILTHIGEAKLANALALGEPLQITHLAVGDGEGQGAQGTPLPDPAQTTLVSERRRAPLNTLTTDPANQNVLIAEQVIPEDVGGWWIREMGLFDAAGDLIAVCNTPPTYKPVLASGSGRTQVVRMQLIVTDTAAVTLRVDPAVVLATRKYVDDQRQAHEESRAHPAATATEQGMVVLASDAIARAKQSAAHALTPANLDALLASADFAGLVRLADAETAQGLADAQRALTSAALAAVLGTGRPLGNGYASYPFRDAVTGELRHLIVQWGTTAAELDNTVGTVSRFITFPITFPTACLGITVGYRGSSRPLSLGFIAGNTNREGFWGFFENSRSDQNVIGQWIAVGW